MPRTRAVSSGSLAVPGLGALSVLAVPIGENEGWVVLGRAESEDPAAGWTHQETALVRGMGRVLSLTMRMLQVIEAEPQGRRQPSEVGTLDADGVPLDPTRPILPPPGTNGNQNGGKRAATSMDDMEREFLRKKERELQAARMAGAGEMASSL